MMVITIDYFAWDKWRQEGYEYRLFTRRSQKYIGNRPVFVPGGTLACRILHHHQREYDIYYEFYAKNENAPISLLLRLMHDGTNMHYDVATITTEDAAKLDKILLSVPESKQAMMDIFGSGRDTYETEIELGSQYGNKYFDWGFDYVSYIPVDGQWNILAKAFASMMGSGENLTGQKRRKIVSVEFAIGRFDHAFHTLSHHDKYRNRWNSTQKYSKLDPQYEAWLLFKHKLPESMRLMARVYIDRYNQREYSINPHDVFQGIAESQAYRVWSYAEQQALEKYLVALWDYALAYYPTVAIDTWSFIQGIELINIDASPFIAQWREKFMRVECQRHLAEFLVKLFADYIENDNTLTAMPNTMRSWLSELAESQFFLTQYMLYDGNRPYATEFAEASEILAALEGKF